MHVADFYHNTKFIPVYYSIKPHLKGEYNYQLHVRTCTDFTYEDDILQGILLT